MFPDLGRHAISDSQMWSQCKYIHKPLCATLPTKILSAIDTNVTLQSCDGKLFKVQLQTYSVRWLDSVHLHPLSVKSMM
jgi:hypothetical protein